MTKREECLQAFRALLVDVWPEMEVLVTYAFAQPAKSYNRPKGFTQGPPREGHLAALRVTLERSGQFTIDYLTDQHLQAGMDVWTEAYMNAGHLHTSRFRKWKEKLHSMFPTFADLKLFGQTLVLTGKPAIEEREWARDVGVNCGVAREYGDYRFEFWVHLPATQQFNIAADDLQSGRQEAIRKMCDQTSVQLIEKPTPDLLTEIDAKRLDHAE